MYRYTILRVNGIVDQFESPKLSLEALQQQVGGRIELLARPQDYGIGIAGVVYINEDGKRLELPVNTLCKISSYGDFIVGNVLIEEKIK